MSFLVGILAALPVFIAVISAYYFGVFVEKSFDIHNAVVIGVLAITFGIFVWWMLVFNVFPAVGMMLGPDKIPYQP